MDVTTLALVGSKKLLPTELETLDRLRANLLRLAAQRGRKALFGPAGISEATFSRIIGDGVKSIDNPGILTVKALANAGDMTVGELIGELPSDRLQLSNSDARVLWNLHKLDSKHRVAFEELLAMFADAVANSVTPDEQNLTTPASYFPPGIATFAVDVPYTDVASSVQTKSQSEQTQKQREAGVSSAKKRRV